MHATGGGGVGGHNCGRSCWGRMFVLMLRTCARQRMRAETETSRTAQDQLGARTWEEALEEDTEEACAARPAGDPGISSRAECEQHVLARIPYRALCPWCAVGRRRSAQYRRDGAKRGSDARVPTRARASGRRRR